MLNLNKNKIVALVSALFISATSNVFAYATGDYHEVATAEEFEAVQQRWEEVKKEHNNDIVRSDFLEKKIQAPLIKYNQNKLKKASSPYEDGLYNVYVANNEIQNVGESVLNHIYITKGYIDSVLPNRNDYNIYGLSAIASVYGHEAGHWYYNDVWFKNDQPKTDAVSKFQEIRADRFSLSVIDNVPNFSAGGDFIYNYRYARGNGISHPTAKERQSLTYNYILNASNNRVYFENHEIGTNHLLVADKNEQYEFEVYPPNQYEPKAILNEIDNENKTILTGSLDRAFYVSGAIAWSIKNNAWNANSVKYEDAHKYFRDLPSDINATAIIARASNGQYKIIDWYLSPEYLTDKQKTELKNYLINLKASYEY